MAQVSGIEVKISANTDDFDKGIASAGSKIQNFSKLAAVGLAGFATAAAAGGVAIGALTKQAINFADEIGKTAQKIGMTSESLSRLEYAAKLSDVSLGQLQVGLGQLSKNMQAGNEAFTALGISVTDAQGNLRGTEEVLLDVAERFAGMEDGAGKTALAMAILGRSGADLIPMLNAGRDGLAQMTEEASRFGLEISTNTSKAAEGFNDNLTRITSLFTGLANTIAQKSAPKMKDLTDRFIKFVEEGDYVEKIANLIDGAFGMLAETVQFLTSAWEAFTIRLNAAGVALEYIKQGQFANAMDAWAASSEQVGKVWERNTQILANMRKNFQARPEDAAALLESAGNFSSKSKAPRLPGDASAGGEGAGSTVPGVAPSQEVDEFYMARLESIRDGFMSEREILEAEYAADMELLRGHLTGKDELDAEFKDLMLQRAEQHASDLASIQSQRLDGDLTAASSFFGSMAQVAQAGGKRLLKVAKAAAAAQAIVDTIRAAVSAMNDPTAITPIQKFANYAAVFAKGMSAVAAIKGVSEGGGGGGSSGGGGGRRGGGGGASAAPAAASPTTTFQFTMMNDPMGFGEKFARQFIDQLNSTQRNGGTIRGVIA
jgi:hypothetical protein